MSHAGKKGRVSPSWIYIADGPLHHQDSRCWYEPEWTKFLCQILYDLNMRYRYMNINLDSFLIVVGLLQMLIHGVIVRCRYSRGHELMPTVGLTVALEVVPSWIV